MFNIVVIERAGGSNDKTLVELEFYKKIYVCNLYSYYSYNTEIVLEREPIL
mgnify:CR=1 FL=1